MTIIIALGISLAYLIASKFAVITRADVWWSSVNLTVFCFLLCVAAIYVLIIVRAKKKIGYIFGKEKKCRKGHKIITYTQVTFEQSFGQKIFGLCTIRFKNTDEKIIMRDVSTENLKYAKKRGR